MSKIPFNSYGRMVVAVHVHSLKSSKWWQANVDKRKCSSLFIEDHFLSCRGLCGNVLSVLHLSHSGLSSLYTLSSLPQIRGPDVNHWFAISQIEWPICVKWSQTRIWIGWISTSRWTTFHVIMNHFYQEDDLVMNADCVFSYTKVGDTLTLDLRLMVRMCCRPEESSAFILNIWNWVSMKSSLRIETYKHVNIFISLQHIMHYY